MPWQATVQTGVVNLVIGGNGPYETGDVVTLTDAQYATIDPTLFATIFTATPVAVGVGVPATRTVTTTTPLQGGGDLSADRTLSISFGLTANIQSLGTAAAGSSGLVTDAAHVHPMPRLDQVLAPTASVAMGSQKITGLAPGVASTDAATVGQLSSGGSPTGAASGDLGGTYPSPTVVATHLSAALPIAQGGTGQATSSAAFNALSPMTTVGDLTYESAANTASRLAGNITTTKKFLTQTGTGTVSAAPAWGTISAGDIPTLNQNTTGTASNVTGTVAIANGGTGQTSASAGFNALSPITTLGDLIYGSGSNAASRLAGSTSATKQFLTQTGNGSVSAAPAWGGISAGDIPTLNQNTTGTASNVTGTVAIANGGTGQVSASAAYNALTPITTLGDLVYGSGANTAARLAGSTSATKQFLTQTGTGSASAAPAWGAIAAGDIPTLNQNTTGTASNVTGTVAIANGGTGQTTASAALSGLGGVALSTVTTKGDLLVATGSSTIARQAVGTDIQILMADSTKSTGVRWDAVTPRIGSPVTGALAETMPPMLATSTNAPTSGTLYIWAVNLYAGQVIGHVGFVTGGTAAVGPTHWWTCVLDNTYKLQAVSADQLTTAITANTWFSLAMAASYTATYTGRHYLGFMVAVSTTMPNVCQASGGIATPMITGAGAPTPLLGGPSNTGQTTPGTAGTTTYNAPNNNANCTYMYAAA